MQTTLELTGRSLGTASSHLLGFNLDWLSDVPWALLSQRLKNPTFWGPADFQTGLAPSWKKMMDFYGGMRFELEPGANMHGGPCQRVHVYDRGGNFHSGMVQPHRFVKAGERIRVVLWARCQGQPVDLTVGFRHTGLAGPTYGSARVLVDRSHFARYEVEIPISASDDDCLFFCYLGGNGIVYFDRILAEPVDEPIFRKDTMEAMSTLPLGALRWPAGCSSSNYHWRRGVGPQHLRYDDADMTFHWGMSYTHGTDEYLELCRMLDVTPHLIANIGTGTVEEAGAWAEYCAQWYRNQGLELPEMIWQIGNEHGGNHEAGHMDAAMYARVLQEFVPSIRSHYPRAVICSAACEGDWATTIIERAPDMVDLISMHFYACHVDGNAARSGLAFLRDAETYAGRLDELSAMIAEQNLPIKLAVTEWGAFRSESHTDEKFYDPPTTWGAMWIDAMVKHFLRRADRMGLANNYSLLNVMASLVVRGREVERTTYGDYFAFWKDLLPSTILETKNDSPHFVPPHPDNDPDEWSTPWSAEGEVKDGEDSVPWLNELAGENEAGRWLMLTNRHPETVSEVILPPEFKSAQVELLMPGADGLHYSTTQATPVKANRVTVPPGAHCRVLR